MIIIFLVLLYFYSKKEYFFNKMFEEKSPFVFTFDGNKQLDVESKTNIIFEDQTTYKGNIFDLDKIEYSDVKTPYKEIPLFSNTDLWLDRIV